MKSRDFIASGSSSQDFAFRRRVSEPRCQLPGWVSAPSTIVDGQVDAGRVGVSPLTRMPSLPDRYRSSQNVAN
jgi:hypothetical protein